jgi:hypothetical protein
VARGGFPLRNVAADPCQLVAKADAWQGTLSAQPDKSKSHFLMKSHRIPLSNRDPKLEHKAESGLGLDGDTGPLSQDGRQFGARRPCRPGQDLAQLVHEGATLTRGAFLERRHHRVVEDAAKRNVENRTFRRRLTPLWRLSGRRGRSHAPKSGGWDGGDRLSLAAGCATGSITRFRDFRPCCTSSRLLSASLRPTCASLSRLCAKLRWCRGSVKSRSP